MTTDQVWRLALHTEMWRQLRGEPDDATRAARGVFDQYAKNAAFLVREGFLERMPREVDSCR